VDPELPYDVRKAFSYRLSAVSLLIKTTTLGVLCVSAVNRINAEAQRAQRLMMRNYDSMYKLLFLLIADS
jgi:hypothetical protein